MAQIYVNDLVAVERANASRRMRSPITLSGLDDQGNVKVLDGIVQSVEDGHARYPGYKWRVTILSSNTAPQLKPGQ